MNQVKRIIWLDMAKGYGMILVIAAHVGVGAVGTWIYSFHIPLFFFLSGYVFNEKSNFMLFIKSKCRSMLVPYVCLGLSLFIFDTFERYYTSGALNYSDCVSILFSYIVQRRMSTLWFLACLTCLNFAFYFIKKVLKTNGKMLILAFATTCIGTLYYKAGGNALPWNIDVCLMAYPFFLMGYLYREKSECIDKYLDDKKYSIYIFFILVIINIVSCLFSLGISGRRTDMYDSSYGCVPFALISALSGIACVIIISKKTNIKLVRYVGKNSLLYFAWHQTIMMPLSATILSLFRFSINDASNSVLIGLYKMLQFILIMLLLTVSNYCIVRTKLRFILGKR